ncbi:MAG: ribonuclease HII [Eubacteriales bacterium]|nr:ribonuclease HII [Eubacteriales bacterium]
MSVYEKKYRLAGYSFIAGIDEAGRGPLAGPVVAAAVILPQGSLITGVNDSKKISEKNRELLYDVIKNECISWAAGIIDEKEIDSINILNATIKAMYKAIGGLSESPDFLLIDAVKLEKTTIPSESIIRGDALSISVAAASIMAKVTRDRIMREYDKIWPQYGFAAHKGYGTAQHMDAIMKYGLCEIHRRSFTRFAP